MIFAGHPAHTTSFQLHLDGTQSIFAFQLPNNAFKGFVKVNHQYIHAKELHIIILVHQNEDIKFSQSHTRQKQISREHLNVLITFILV